MPPTAIAETTIMVLSGQVSVTHLKIRQTYTNLMVANE